MDEGTRVHLELRTVMGAVTIAVMVAIVAGAIAMFRGDFIETVPLTVLSPRAGLVMNPDAKVKLHGAQIGTVASIEQRPDGQAALHLAMDPAQLSLVPANVGVSIASTTAFGAKYVELIPPANPASQPVQPGQVLDADHVTVEINTVFQQLVSVLGSIEPEKLNQTLGAMATALNGRGAQFGQTLGDVNALLTKLDPSLPQISADLELLPGVVNSYADAAPDLITIADKSTRISQTVVEEQQNLDALLLSSIGLADIGNDVLATTGQPLIDVVHLMAPTTDLLSEYAPGLKCALGGILRQAKTPPAPVPGALSSASFGLGIERYRYPKNLPKVAATGGPQCVNLPVPFGTTAPFVVTDNGSNPWEYGNQSLLLNSDALKEALFGPLDGPPRNTAQIGQPG